MSNQKLKSKLLTERERKIVCKLNWPKDQAAILKVAIGKDPMEKSYMDREKIVLEVLKNLAVPKRKALPRIEVSRMVKNDNFAYVAMEYLPWKDCFDRSFSIAQALGLWAFVLEQICAFRRKDILYTDLKSTHLLVSDDLTEARIIDFGNCIKVESQGQYPIGTLGHSPLFGAPEFYFSVIHTERVLLYQAGMLLASFLFKKLTNPKLQPETLKKIKGRLLKNCLLEVNDILEKCLSKRPTDRPQNIETLFAKLQRINLPPDSYRLWVRLRAPYRKELSKLNFSDPEPQVILKAA
jgi:serine/threonine protein kinase